MITPTDISSAVADLRAYVTSEKYLYLAANGGNEKAVQAELAYILQKKLDADDYWVYLEKYRLDIAICINGQPHFNPEVIIELGHYTLNQALVLNDDGFKPFTDIDKRKDYKSSELYHVMIFEHVRKTKNARTFKYGFARHVSITDYESKYTSRGIKYVPFSYLKNAAFGYEIDVHLILAGPF